MIREPSVGGDVKVIHGANDGVFALAGEPVCSVRASLVDAFNIPADAISFVNGEQVDMTYTLEADDTLEFCKQNGNKGGRRMLTKADILREYTGYPANVMEELFSQLPYHEETPDGRAKWHELAVDVWLDNRYLCNGVDDNHDKVIPPDSVRINGEVYGGLTLNEWRLIDALLKAPNTSLLVDDAIEHLYADDASTTSTSNRLKQAIKRLNQKSGEKRRPFSVHIENGWVSLLK